ncbi:MAG TPA: SpoIIE family protein phosphatase [Blastocatellia bacterium]
MRKRLQLILGGIFFALLIIYSGDLFVRALGEMSKESDPGWSAYTIGNQVRIRQVSSHEATRTLRVHDSLIALNGQPLTSKSQVVRFFRDVPPGSLYMVTIRRGGQALDLVFQSQAIPLSAWIFDGAANLIIPNIFLVTGLLLFLLKPYDKQALLLALMFGMFNATLPALNPDFGDAPVWLVTVMLTVHVASSFLWPVFFHFFQIFPEPSPLLRRVPRLGPYIYLPHLLTAFPHILLLNILAAFAPLQGYALQAGYPIFGVVSRGVATMYIAGGLLSLLINYREAGRASRRKMRVVVAGSIAGFLPFFIVVGLAVIFNLPTTNPQLSQWLGFAAFFSFPLFPLSFVYAIIRHQVIPVRLILRRGVRYLLVSRGFIIIQAVVVFGVLSFLLTGSRLAMIDRLGDRADIVATMAATALAIGVLTVVNQRVLPIIDRKFFREAYDAQQILSELGMEMRKVTAVRQLLELAVSKIQDALHVENVTIFLKDEAGADYRCAISSHLTEDGETTTDINRNLVIPGDGYAAVRMKHSSLPLTVDRHRSGAWGQELSRAGDGGNESRQRERVALRRIRTNLLLPVATKDELLGIISLGPRLGDLPFSSDDKQLLMAVAIQMALAVQNARLVQEIAQEERLRHELEIATAVQRRLFPERPPDVASLELAGVCHPARGVGGDYYDFILLDEGNVGIAVADVAGKGISAALLMSTVQASLRSQAPSVNGNLVDLVSSMNKLLHISTDSASYATFFYAQFDEKSGLLTYVNAGHNPPLLVRVIGGAKAHGARQVSVTGTDKRAVKTEMGAGPHGATVTELTTGGPIIGAFPFSVYQQETIQMESGDLLLAYTDGVTEAFNPVEEEFGEERLRQFAASSAHLSAQALTEKIVETVSEWCQDTPQHDDLTLVVMKVK